MHCYIKLFLFAVRAKQELHKGSFAGVHFRTDYIQSLMDNLFDSINKC